MSFLNKIFGDPNEKVVKKLQPIVDKINSFEDEIKAKSDAELKALSEQFKKSLKGKNEDELVLALEELLPKAFAVVREAAKRILNQRHYDVQLIGGIVLHRGQIAEMKTGEGKTLVATLPLYLNALVGQGAHLVTVNDYLAQVGAGWMAPVFYSLGLDTGVIIHETGLMYDPEYVDESQYDERLKHFKPVTRKEAYDCDITYGTNNEFGFDYLRDNMAPNLNTQVQGRLSYAIVDEVDSILIDEARTPLIISAPTQDSTDKYFKFAQLVKQLKEDEDYNIDEKMRSAVLTEAGIGKMEKWLGVENIYTTGGIREVHHIEQALKAYALFKADKDYVVREGEVIIVDEFTGRLMQGRRYSEGLHQAIEAKEGVKIQRESQTLATITFQNFFRMYKKLSGMTGTAVTEAEEFSKIYLLDTVIIPTNKPSVRRDENDLIFRTEAGKYQAVIKEVKKRNKKGQPVLIGTISIEKNEMLADMMERQGLRPNVLNAKNHEKEARFIAQAGEPGAITIATNMAGRGVDIILGGNEAGSKQHKEVKELGGLHVIGTERHESRRIDNQLRGRAGRQGDPGSSQFFVSMDDDLMRIFGGDRMKSIMATLKVPEDMPIENRLISRSIETAQHKVEGNNFDVRKHLVEYDDVINKHREAIYRRRQEVLEIRAQQLSGDEKNQDQLSDIILKLVENEVEQVVSFHTAAEKQDDWNISEIEQVTGTVFPVDDKFKKELNNFTKSENQKLDKAKIRTAIIEYLLKKANEKYKLIKNKVNENNVDWNEIEKSVLVRSIDTIWVEHLDAMSSVRQGIGLRGYGQRDPLVEYKKEAFRLYNELNSLIQKEVVYSIFKIGLVSGDKRSGFFGAPSLADRAKQFSAPAKTMDEQGTASFAGFKKAAQDNAGGSDNNNIDTIKQKAKNDQGEKVGRNDPCPCGSGKKYKKCCGN